MYKVKVDTLGCVHCASKTNLTERQTSVIVGHIELYRISSGLHVCTFLRIFKGAGASKQDTTIANYTHTRHTIGNLTLRKGSFG